MEKPQSVMLWGFLLFCGNFSEQNLGYGHKKRSSAELQPFVNLKSNTMKNTLQR